MMVGGRRLDEMRDNAVVVARRASSESWRIGDRPMVASPCRCATPVWERDEVGEDAYQLGTRCVKCGRRAPVRASHA